MHKLNIAVLMGGMSSEHEISLISGQNVLDYLDKNKYNTIKIIISKKGEWMVNNQRKTIDEALRGIDAVFNALHGEYGEDGKIQGLLDCFGISYTGSGVLASALGMDKIRSRELFRANSLVVPEYAILSSKIKNFIKKFKRIVVKPSYLGSSVGVSIVDSKDKTAIKQAIGKALETPHQNN